MRGEGSATPQKPLFMRGEGYTKIGFLYPWDAKLAPTIYIMS